MSRSAPLLSWPLGFAFALLPAFAPAPSRAAPWAEEATTRSALFVLKQATEPHRSGRHNMLMRALRHLEDPRLAPIFEALVRTHHPAMKIHGLLGLAEISENRTLDLGRLATIENPSIIAQTLGAAMDAEMITAREASQIMAWEDLDPGVRLVVATILVREGRLEDPAELQLEAVSDTSAENAFRLGLTALLMTELDAPGAEEFLERVSELPRRQRRRAVNMMLRTAVRHRFTRLGPWALALARDPELDFMIVSQALGAAIRLRAPGASETWFERFGAETDPTRRMRLALAGLQAAPWLPAPLPHDPSEHEGPIIRRMLRTIAALAGGQDGREPIAALIETGYVPALRWALDYAREEAEAPEAVAILSSLIDRTPQENGRDTQRRLEVIASAVTRLAEAHPEAAAGHLGPLLRDTKTEPRLVRTVLLGLVRSQNRAVASIVPPPERFPSPAHRGLAAFLHARAGAELAEPDRQRLRLIVRGGGGHPETVRLQAAWLYLVRAGEAERALEEVLKTLETGTGG